MRSAVILSSFAALAAAQSIEISLISAAPSVVVTAAPVTGTSQSVSAQPTAAAATIGSAAVQSSAAPQRRNVPVAFGKRDGTCASQPLGAGPSVTYPDAPQHFEEFPYFTYEALTAPIPEGYTLNFTNLNASTSTSSYMGYTNLNSYNSTECASLCNAITGCVAINLYFERDPSLDPNAVSCPNPPSITNIKCVFWGVPVSAATATNEGQYRDSFEVVIAGSNGYNMIPTPPSVPGFTGPTKWGGAPNCPFDPTSGKDTYIGSKYFSFGIFLGQIQYFSTDVCVAACAAQTAVDFALAPAFPFKPTVCNFVVAYMLRDNFGIPQGMYCTLFTESWDASYGTIEEVYYGNEEWTVGAAFAYTNATYAAAYSPIGTGSYKGGNCGGLGAGTC